MLIGYNILNKKEKSGMINMKLRVFSLKTKYQFVLKKCLWAILRFPVDWYQRGSRTRAAFLDLDLYRL